MAKRKKKYIFKTKEQVLDELKKKQRFNLLDVKAKDKAPSGDDILISKFEEVNAFIDENKRFPDGKSSPIEFKLYQRVLEINLDDKKIASLRKYDRHQILRQDVVGGPVHNQNSEPKAKPPKESKLGLKDKFGLLASPGSSIFKLKNVKKSSEKVTTMPEKVAKRKKCKDFEEFRPLFEKCQAEIENGDRRVVKFRNEHDVKVGSFFIYGGLKCYVAEMGKVDLKNRKNARLRLIFENEQESNMLRRSLTAELYKDGRRVLPPRVAEGQEEILDEESNGFIYILKSKSSLDVVKSVPNLHKIGFCTTPVKQRVANARNEATYLMSDVEIVASYKVSGIKPTYFENLVHKLFGHVQVKIDVFDVKGRKFRPKEWFSVPYDVIEDALALIQSGEIIKYIYNSESEKLVKKME